MSRRVFIVSFGQIEYDGRLKELANVFAHFGDVKLICCTNGDTPGLHKLGSSFLNFRSYFSFLKYALSSVKGIRKEDVLVADNMFAAFPSLVIKILRRPGFVIQDVRELYFPNEMHGKGKLFVYAERALMNRADLVLCANEERAKIMSKEVKMKRFPIVFENVRFLEGAADCATLDKKYSGLFSEKYKIVSTSGIFMKRDTEKLLRAMGSLSSDYALYIVGGGTDEDRAKLCDLSTELELNNVHLLEKVSMEELRYIVRRCDIGAVHYHKRDLNNLYCASGKIYEYLHEGLPIVSTDNPPLAKFFEESKTGIASDDFASSIEMVANNYSAYKNRVISFMSGISVSGYNLLVAEQIESAIKLGIIR